MQIYSMNRKAARQMRKYCQECDKGFIYFMCLAAAMRSVSVQTKQGRKWASEGAEIVQTIQPRRVPKRKASWTMFRCRCPKHPLLHQAQIGDQQRLWKIEYW